MSKKEDYEAKTGELVMPILEREGFSLYDIDYAKEAGTYYLRVFIDKPGGITINDCETVSRELSDKLDKDDFIKDDSYILEVSSPGLGRALKKPGHFLNSLDEEIHVKLFKPVNGSKEYTGLLKSYNDGLFTMELEDGSNLEIAVKDAADIRLTFDF